MCGNLPWCSINIHIGLTDMKLNTLAKLTLLGLGYVYTIKLAGTFYQGLFKTFYLALPVVGLNILAGLAQCLFFVALQRQFVPKENPVLRVAVSFAIIGSAMALLPKIITAVQLLYPHTAFLSLVTPLNAMGPWLAAVFLLIFSVLFLRNDRFRQNKPLRRAFAGGAAGWFIMASAQSLVVIHYLTGGRLVWFANLFAAGPAVFVVLSTLTLLGLCYFYQVFARLTKVSRRIAPGRNREGGSKSAR